MQRFTLLLLCALVMVGCVPGDDLHTSPLETIDYRKAHFPIVRFREPAFQSKKKCLERVLAPCSALDDVGAVWDYGITARACEGKERIVYLDSPEVYESWIWQESAPSEIYMIFNEPDLSRWQWGSIDTVVEYAHRALVQWSDGQPVGPCIAGDVEYLRIFLLRYREKYGHDYPLRAVCGHCYSAAEPCIDYTLELIDLAEQYGVPVWLTEFNMVPGLYLSADDIVKHNGCFTRFLEDHPQVERYCMWGAGLGGAYGWTIPGNPVTGWQTTHYRYRKEDGTVIWRMTEVGWGYADEPPTWEQCLGWGIVREDQIVTP